MSAEEDRVRSAYQRQVEALAAARKTRGAGASTGRGTPSPDDDGGAPAAAGPWSGSTRRSRLPKGWPALRLEVLKAAAYRCEVRLSDDTRCDAPSNTADHVIAGDDHSRANLQAICTFHHREKTGKEANAARRPNRTNAREPDQHPGAYSH